MGRRTGKKPEVSDSFLMRICHAIDETPRELAKSLGVEYSELKPLLTGGLCDNVEMDRDEVWWKLAEYISRRIGSFLAVKGELNKALQKDRAKRIVQQKRFKRYHDDN